MINYDLFISHHRDSHSWIAQIIRKKLEVFAKPFYKRHSFKVFVDQNSMNANPKLWNKLQENLLSSKYLLYIASPTSAKRDWVNREIEFWLANKRIENFIILKIEGNITWDKKTNNFGASTDAIPKPLYGAYDDEPLFIDASWLTSFTDEDDSRIEDCIAMLASTILDRPKDEVIGENLKQYKRTKKIIWSSSVVLLVLLIISVSLTVKINETLDIAVRRLDEILTANTIQYIENGDLENARSALEEVVNQTQFRKILNGFLTTNQFELIEKIGAFDNHPCHVFSPDGIHLIGYGNGWDGAELFRFSGKDFRHVTHLSIDSNRSHLGFDFHKNRCFLDSSIFTRNGKLLALPNFQLGGLEIWDLETLKFKIYTTRESLGISDSNEGVKKPITAFSKSGKYLMLGQSIYSIQQNSIELNPLHQISLPFLNHFEWSDSDSFLYVLSPKENIYRLGIMDAEIKEILWEIELQEQIKKIKFSDEHKHILVITQSEAIVLHSERGNIVVGYKGSFVNGAISPKGTRMALVSSEGDVILLSISFVDYEIQNAQEIFKFSIQPTGKFNPGKRSDYVELSYNSQGTRLLLSGDQPVIISPVAGSILMKFGEKDYPYPAHSAIWDSTDKFVLINRVVHWGSLSVNSDIYRVASDSLILETQGALARFLQKNDLIVVANENYLEIYDIGGSLIKLFHPPGDEIKELKVSANGEVFITLSDKGITIWDASNLSPRTIISLEDEKLFNVTISPNGKYIGAASDSLMFYIWDSKTSKLIDAVDQFVFFNPNPTLFFSTDSQRVNFIRYSLTNGTGTMHRYISQKKIGSKETDMKFIDIDINSDYTGYDMQPELDADGIAVDNENDAAIVIDLEYKKTIAKLKGHIKPINSVNKSKDGAFLVTASKDSTAKIWSSETGQLIRTLDAHEGGVLFAEFSPDSRKLLTIGVFGEVRVWELF